MPIWVRITSKKTKSRYLLLLLTQKQTLNEHHKDTGCNCNPKVMQPVWKYKMFPNFSSRLECYWYESNCDCWELQREAFTAVWFSVCRGHLAMASKIRQLWIGKMSSPKHWKQKIWERCIGEIWKASGCTVLLVWSDNFGDSHWYPQGTKKLLV